MTLIKGAKACYDLLRTKKAGDVVTVAELLRATKWKQSTLQTYVGKDKLAPFLKFGSDGSAEVRLNGASLSEKQFGKVFTQKASS